jgi:hypothetical protein
MRGSEMKNNLIERGIEAKVVHTTDLSRKLTIDGITKAYQVYKVRLDQLYFNDKNDRIATWISKYKADNNISDIDLTDLESYNSIIHDFIVESNPQAIKSTMANIDLVGQREPGVVLNDGRIIDGNRRFTCLREIAASKGKEEWFETVILDYDLKNNEKQIKLLELNIQHGYDKIVDYNPIDRLVGVYNDIVDRKLFTIEEYAKGIDKKPAEVRKTVDKAILMVEFLEYINAPKQFYIARDMKLDGPLQELAAILEKHTDLETRDAMKNAAFTNFLVQPEGDMTRCIRGMKKIVDRSILDTFLEEQAEISEQVLELLPQEITEKEINNVIRTQDNIKAALSTSLDKAVDRSDVISVRGMPIQQLRKASELISTLDKEILSKLAPEQLEELQQKTEEIEEGIRQIKETISARRS